ncbi:hypothetical protein OWM54_31750 [Myxococcus sp. MISCRS1]|uniref:hypothetical protein n=1 Tax=Myxococcus TaxID=32 RepID=UPI001CBFAE88|nr:MULTISPECIES: hypothetical protein [unclassified Myxococcus]MBZ4394767.1 hypothetical protein [Myxococcus sp. AS-1-15]MBZ4410239.1 hypothetical protein [Myxococcus sp. XM-1-1-1]MCY1001738.1 hypothetical protein [Myxococcus sp. MISCRS1]BDT36690.1 hypothetical protein MFMH1_63590 [Myxococcus sp. MH1]
MKRWSMVLAVAAMSVGCQNGKKEDRGTRAQVRKTGPATMEVIPSAGQLPYCMLYTVSEKGVIRQLTLTRENRSIRCDANKPVANTSFRVPTQEGKVKVYIFFSDERIPAGPVAQQLYDLRGQDRISAMDLRLPGRVFVETMDFVPEEGTAEITGAVVGTHGEVTDSGSGAAPDQDLGATVLGDGGTAGAQPAAADEGT